MSRLGVIRTAMLCLASIWGQGSLVTFTNRDIQSALIEPGTNPVILSFDGDPVGEGGDLFHVVSSEPGVEVVLILPSGVEVSGTSFESQPGGAMVGGPLSMPGFHTVLEVPPSASPGSYLIRATPRELARRALVLAIYTSSSTVRTAVTAGQSGARQGAPIALSGMVFEGAKPLAGATAKLRIVNRDVPGAAEERIELVPVAGNEGVYVAAWTPAVTIGNHLITMRTSGLASSGARYGRFATTQIRVTAPLAWIRSLTDSAVDDGGDGIADRVVLDFQVEAETAGDYRLQLTLQATNRTSLPIRLTATLAKGGQRISVPVSFQNLAKLGADGPYLIRDVALVYLGDREQPIADDPGEMGSTGAYPAGELAGTPKVGVTVSPAALAFGDVSVGAVRDLTLTLTNSGSYPFTAAQIRLTNTAFRIVSAAPPVLVPGKGQTEVIVRFQPAGSGGQTGELTVAGYRIPLSGNGVGAANGPRLEVSPAALGFGTVAVGQTRDLPVTVRNTGTATLAISNLVSTNGRFTVTPVAPVLVAAGGQAVLTVRFTPTAAGAQNGSLLLTSNDPGGGVATLPLEGSGGGQAGPQTVVLSLDDGTAEAGYAGVAGRDGYYLNRLTPSAYPATLRRIQIFHPADGLAAGAVFQLLAAANPSGAAAFPSVALRTVAARVGATGRYVEYDIEPITISSGDFLAGFLMRGDGANKSVAIDSTNYRERSYVGSSATAFSFLDQVAGVPRGNLMIRAVIE